MSTDAKTRLEYLRGELRAERISYGELAELQGLADEIDPGDTELLEAAGVPEFREGPYESSPAGMTEAHAEGLHEDLPREGCPECKAVRRHGAF